MKREILITSDGSTTIHLPDLEEQYHSKHGAIQEAYHVFINAGLQVVSQKEIAILEIGFGTGLNCFLTLLEKGDKHITYVGVEAYPVKSEEIERLNFVSLLNAKKHEELFYKMHSSSWGNKHELIAGFSLIKQQKFFKEISEVSVYNLIYFDAFGARVQPELWTEAIFKKMYVALKKDGVLVTYSAKGSVRRAMQAVGFIVERLPGPPGKREMLRAIKR